MQVPRRDFLKSVALTAGLLAVPSFLRAETAGKREKMYIGCNQYAFNSFLARDGIDSMQEFDKSLEIMKNAGLDGVELIANQPDDLVPYWEKLKNHDMALKTIYVGPNLHDDNVAESEMTRILAVAEKVATFGTEIIVINLAAKEKKTEEELVLQSKNLDLIGSKLRKIGPKLALHYHTTELEFGGREFHHVLGNTDPKNLTLCFEMQWSYRASGNSADAVFDHLERYGNRVSSVHLRQSQNNIWSETFEDGDIDNRRLAAGLKKAKVKPIFVLEQAAENGTPKTMSADEVFRKSTAYIRDVFGNI